MENNYSVDYRSCNCSWLIDSPGNLNSKWYLVRCFNISVAIINNDNRVVINWYKHTKKQQKTPLLLFRKPGRAGNTVGVSAAPLVYNKICETFRKGSTYFVPWICVQWACQESIFPTQLYFFNLLIGCVTNIC